MIAKWGGDTSLLKQVRFFKYFQLFLLVDFLNPDISGAYYLKYKGEKYFPSLVIPAKILNLGFATFCLLKRWVAAAGYIPLILAAICSPKYIGLIQMEASSIRIMHSVAKECYTSRNKIRDPS